MFAGFAADGLLALGWRRGVVYRLLGFSGLATLCAFVALPTRQ